MKVKLWLFAALLACVDFRQSNGEVVFAAELLDLSYEECFRNDTCKSVTKFIKDTAAPIVSPWQVVDQDEALRNYSPSRTKRRIFGVDNRLRIRAPYTQKHPFSTTVAVSSSNNGNLVTCSGIALSRYLVLTAAHCLLSPRGKLRKVSHLKVGVLQRNDILKWTQVERIKVHGIWKKKKNRRRKGRFQNFKKFISNYDYAVLQTVAPLKVSSMAIAIVSQDEEGNEILKAGRTFMHSLAFDDKRPNIMRYRFCRMEKVKLLFIYNRCDTVPKTAGAGVYVLMRNKDSGKVERKIIAIATGDYKKVSKNDSTFSSALRITRLQFGQICYWITNNLKECGYPELKLPVDYVLKS